MPKAIIIEDESLAAQRLEALVRKCDGSIEIIGKLSSVKASVEWLRNNPRPDLIFMDIHLDDGSSFAIFEQIDVQAPVIFTTAYDEYTIKAFKVNSIDYLLKPINAEDLGYALEQFRRLKLASYYYSGLGDSPIENLKKTAVKSRFMVSTGNKLVSIPVEDIAYFYSEDKMTFLQLTTGGRHVIEYSLDKLMPLLAEDRFFRINRQFIVGMDSIDAIHKISSNRLKLALKPAHPKPIYVSLDKYTPFRDWLDA